MAESFASSSLPSKPRLILRSSSGFNNIGSTKRKATDDDSKPAAVARTSKHKAPCATAGKENAAVLSINTISSSTQSRLNAFQKRQQELEQYCKDAGSDCGLLHLSDTEEEHSILGLLCKDQLREWGKSRAMELMEQKKDKEFYDFVSMRDSQPLFKLVGGEKRLELYNSITSQQLDLHYNVVLIRKQHLQDLQNRIKVQKRQSIKTQKEFWMLRLSDGIQLIYQAIETLVPSIATGKRSGFPAFPKYCSTTIPNVARNAFEYCLAVIMLCDELADWMLDEDPNSCEQLIKRLNKMLRMLLWFRNDELGFVDPFSRNSLLNYLNKLRVDWKYIILEDSYWFHHDFETIDYSPTDTIKNNNGQGRSLNAPPASRPAVAARSLKPPNVIVPGKHTKTCTDYLTALGDKLLDRTKTQVQLEIGKLEWEGGEIKTTKDEDVFRVVVSGAMDLRKLGQLLAFITGRASSYEIDGNRGKRLDASYFKLSVDEAETLVGHKVKNVVGACKGNGWPLLADKPIKIAQVFQGLITSKTSGMIYDSEQAKRFNKCVNSFTWNAHGDKNKPALSLYIICQGVMANKCVEEKWPLPRLLDGGKIFGQKVKQLNCVLRGNRKGGPSFVAAASYGVDIMAAKRTLEPICDVDGYVPWGSGYFFAPTKVASAGLPTPYSTSK